MQGTLRQKCIAMRSRQLVGLVLGSAYTYVVRTLSTTNYWSWVKCGFAERTMRLHSPNPNPGRNLKSPSFQTCPIWPVVRSAVRILPKAATIASTNSWNCWI